MGVVSEFLGMSMAFGVDVSASCAAQPHFHARYGDDRAVFDIVTGDVIDGSLSPRAVGFVKEWIALRRAALWSNWSAIQENQVPSQIAPLE